jgi:hypothetical protein
MSYSASSLVRHVTVYFSFNNSSLSTILRFARTELTTANCILYPMPSIRLPELRETIFKLKTDAKCYTRKKCVFMTDVGEVERKHRNSD